MRSSSVVRSGPSPRQVRVPGATSVNPASSTHTVRILLARASRSIVSSSASVGTTSAIFF